jgi:hypothetical protein
MATPEFFDSGINRAASAQLAKYFTDAAKRLSDIVANPPGKTQAARDFRAAFAAQKIDQITTILKAQSSAWAGVQVTAAYKDGIARAHQQAVDAGVVTDTNVRPTAGSFTLIDQRTVQRFALDTVMDLHKAADSLGDRTVSVLRQTQQLGLAESDINKILAGGVIEGKPVETIRALREAMRAVHGESVEINGRNFDVKYYAEMVARTKTRQATVQARHGRLEELGLDLVAIVGRVSDNFCTAFLGQVFSLSGKSTKYPAYSSLPGGGPPFHPNCTKSTRPFVEELASSKQLDNAEILPASEKLLGQTPTQAQRSFKDLQIRSEISERYAATAARMLA